MLLRREVRCADGLFSILRRDAEPDANALPVVWSHATGFHAAAYAPLLEALAPTVDVQAVDARGHGETRAPCDSALLKSWHVYYNDLAALLDTFEEGRKVILAGHSMGATASVFAAAMRPERVARLVLVEPVFYPPGTGVTPRKKLMAAAAKRRNTFTSLQEAFDSYRPRAAFRGLSDRWLWSYVNGAFKPAGANEYVLRCPTPWEYRTFETNERWPWFAVARAKAPAVVLLGEFYSACPPSGRALLRLLQPRWQLTVVPDTTHLLPMERPASVFDAIVEAVDASRTSAPPPNNPA